MKFKQDLSVGVVPYRKDDSKKKFLLIQHRHGKHWGFPKGHPETRDKDKWETAQRELFEEVGLKIRSCKKKSFDENYSFVIDDVMVNKQVVYFVAEVEGEVREQEEEISAHLWLGEKDVLSQLSFDNSKQLFKRVLQEYFS